MHYLFLLGTLAKQIEVPSKFIDLLDYQESLLAWKRNDYEISRYLLRKLIHRKSIDPVLQARVLRIYGNWMAETKSENPQVIIAIIFRIYIVYILFIIYIYNKIYIII